MTSNYNGINIIVNIRIYISKYPDIGNTLKILKESKMSYWKLWTALGLVIVLSFAVLGYYGLEIYRQAPPIPAQVVTTEGEVLFTGQNIRDGQNVWQSTGGQQMGTIWGHGSYVAPDWSADWLHREAVWLMNYWAKEDYGVESYEELEPEAFAALKLRLKGELGRTVIILKQETW